MKAENRREQKFSVSDKTKKFSIKKRTGYLFADYKRKNIYQHIDTHTTNDEPRRHFIVMP